MADPSRTLPLRALVGPEALLPDPNTTGIVVGSEYHSDDTDSMDLAVPDGPTALQWVRVIENGAVVGTGKYVVTPPGPDQASGLYNTITEGIQAAVDDGHGEADPAVILVQPGTYTEDLVLRTGISVVSLEGEAFATVTVVGSVSTAPADVGTVLCVGLHFTDADPATPTVTLGGAAVDQNVMFQRCQLSATGGAPALRVTWVPVGTNAVTLQDSSLAASGLAPGVAAVEQQADATVVLVDRCDVTVDDAATDVALELGGDQAFTLVRTLVRGQVRADGAPGDLEDCSLFSENPTGTLYVTGATTVQVFGGILSHDGDPAADDLVGGDAVPAASTVRLVGVAVAGTTSAGVRRINPAVETVGSFQQRPLSQTGYGPLFGGAALAALVLTEPEDVVALDTDTAAGTVTVTLPPLGVVGDGFVATIKNVGNTTPQPVHLSPAGGQTIDLAAGPVVLNAGVQARLKADRASGTWWRVDETANPTWGKYVVAPPGALQPSVLYSTIQAAIDAAVADDHDETTPATVFVHPGTYVENVTLAPGIGLATLAASRGPSVVIEGTAAASGVTVVTGVHFRAPGPGLMAFQATSVLGTFTNCTFEGQDNEAAFYHDGGTAAFVECVFQGGTTYAYFGSAVGENVFDRCTLTGSDPGSSTAFIVENGSEQTLRQCSLRGSFEVRGTDARLYDCAITNENDIGSIWILGGGNVRVYGGTIAQTGDRDTDNLIFCDPVGGTARVTLSGVAITGVSRIHQNVITSAEAAFVAPLAMQGYGPLFGGAALGAVVLAHTEPLYLFDTDTAGAPVAVTLPELQRVHDGYVMVLKNVGDATPQTVNISPAAGQTIDLGAGPVSLTSMQFATLRADLDRLTWWRIA